MTTSALLTPVPPARDEYRCGGCGYGAFLASTARLCPMCGTQHWLARRPRPLSTPRRADELEPARSASA